MEENTTPEDSNAQEMQEDQVKNNSALKHAGSNLGTRLRESREQQQYSRERIVQQLKIPPKWLEAIEESRWHEFTNTTYVRSYIRNYAKILGISIEEELKEALPPLEVTQNNMRNIRPLSHKPIVVDASNHWKRSKLILLLLLFVGLAYGVYILINNKTDWQNQALEDNTTTQNLSLSDITKEEEEEASYTQPSTPLAAILPSTTPSTSIPSTTPSSTSSLPSAETTLINSNEVDAEDESDQTISKNLLEITTNSESWVKVSTINNKEIVSKMLKQGETLNREILPPFHLIIGNAENATVHYAGKAVSLSKYLTPNGNARIKISNP